MASKIGHHAKDGKGGAGFAGRSGEWEIRIDGVTGRVTEETGGIGLGAGLGYDIQLARNFFLTPALDFVYTGHCRSIGAFLLSGAVDGPRPAAASGSGSRTSRWSCCRR